MTEFDELAQVLIIDMTDISIINTCANSSKSVISIKIRHIYNQLMFPFSNKIIIYHFFD